jgi:hypothetical protein
VEVARRSISWLDDRNWLFPAALFVVVILLSTFRISGSSVGSFHLDLYGANVPDKNLLYGQPLSVRSDEWLVSTPYTVSQSRFGYPQTNPTIGQGMDAAVLLDLPNKDWSELFKPQNWSFFVMPLEQAFAFRWWFIGWLMITSSYFVVLLLLPGRRLLAASLSLGLFFTPFIQWWYQTMTLAPVYYSFFAILTFWYILRATSVRQKFALSAAFGYVLSCFALVLYPPFQVPCALAAIAVCAGMLFEQKTWTWRGFVNTMIPALAGVVIAAVVIGLFFLAHSSTVKTIEGTVYPGHRVVASGGYSILHFLDGAFDRQLQFYNNANHYLGDQSSESNFLFLWPFLLIPSLYLTYRLWKLQRKIDYISLTVAALILLFAARLFLPLPQIFGEVLLLSSVPADRLLIGFGILNFFEVVIFVRQIQKQSLSLIWALAMGVAAILVQLGVGLTLHAGYPLFITNLFLVTIISLTIGLIVFLLIQHHEAAAAVILLLFVVWSTHRANPLYIGLGELTHSRLGAVATSQQNAYSSGWAYEGDVRYINLLQAYGLRTYSGTYPYPQLSLMRQFDPKGEYKNIYNRYAYVLFDPSISGMKYYQQDEYAIGYNPCSPVFEKLIKHLVTEGPMSDNCLQLSATVTYPTANFYIYSVK